MPAWVMNETAMLRYIVTWPRWELKVYKWHTEFQDGAREKEKVSSIASISRRPNPSAHRFSYSVMYIHMYFFVWHLGRILTSGYIARLVIRYT